MQSNWKNKEYVLNQVQKDGFNFRFASENLRADPEIVFAAVKNFGWALAHTSEKLQDNKELVLNHYHHMMQTRPL